MSVGIKHRWQVVPSTHDVRVSAPAGQAGKYPNFVAQWVAPRVWAD